MLCTIFTVRSYSTYSTTNFRFASEDVVCVVPRGGTVYLVLRHVVRAVHHRLAFVVPVWAHVRNFTQNMRHIRSSCTKHRNKHRQNLLHIT